jgi:alpha-tubulin suppressor-like RCC1 family protein
MMRLMPRVALAVLAAVLAGCSPEPLAPTPGVPVATVSLLPSGPVVGVGAHAPLTAITLAQTGDTLTQRQITWSSADPAVATVDSLGVVAGVAAGTAAISANVEGKSASLTVTVSSVAVAAVTVTPATLDLTTGNRATLNGSAVDAGNAPLPGRVFAWTSSAPAVATVSPLGVVTAVGAGTATITGTSEGKSATAAVRVTLAPIAAITIEPNGGTVGVGDSLQLTATPRDANGAPLSGRTIQWTTSDPTLTTVDQTGKVRGLTAGSVTITARAEGVTATVTVAVALRFAAVSAGRDFTCGVTRSGSVFCWGQNKGGSLGNGGTTNRSKPGRVVQDSSVRFDSVSAGSDHACALTRTGTILCWGTNTFGQLGNNTTGNSLVPVSIAMPFGVTFVQVRAAASFTCGLSTEGVAFCWGLNDLGELGNGFNYTFPNPNPLPLAVPGVQFRQLSATQGHVCGVDTSGRIVCWGSNSTGQLGRSGNPDIGTPNAETIVGSDQYATIGAGVGFNCGVLLSGSSSCWGSNDSGELGAVTATNAQTTPVPVNTSTSFARISAGNGFACAVGPAGAGSCWGSNASGKLGIGSNSPTISPPGPRAVSGSLVFADISAGWEHACGVTPQGVAHCWGRAEPAGVTGASALGNGTEANSNVPVAVADR